MALQGDMRILVGGLELAASRRAQEERERRETASLDALGRDREALGRAWEERERRETASLDALRRAAGTASRRAEVSERLSGWHQERAAVARDARGPGAGMIGLRGAPDGGRRERDARDATERAARIAALRGEVAGTLGRFQRDRAVQAAWDAIGRVEDERDRQVAAAQDARERAAEISGLGKIWSDHAGTMGSLR